MSIFVAFLENSNFKKKFTCIISQNTLNENHDENLFIYFRTMESEKESMRLHLDEALEEKEDTMRQLSRANGDAALWRSK